MAEEDPIQHLLTQDQSYQLISSALQVLRDQFEQAQSDIITLESLREDALARPISYIKFLQRSKIKELHPRFEASEESARGKYFHHFAKAPKLQKVVLVDSVAGRPEAVLPSVFGNQPRDGGGGGCLRRGSAQHNAAMGPPTIAHKTQPITRNVIEILTDPEAPPAPAVCVEANDDNNEDNDGMDALESIGSEGSRVREVRRKNSDMLGLPPGGDDGEEIDL